MLTILTSSTREEIFLCFLCVFNLCDFRAVFLNDDRLPFETKQIQYDNILSLVLLKLILAIDKSCSNEEKKKRLLCRSC